MKATRRQELRTNELSQIGDYAKQNATKLVVTFAVIAVVLVGGYWFIHHQEQRVLDGWATLSRAAALADSDSSLGSLESVVQENLSPALTTEALLKIGDTAMVKLISPVDNDGLTDVSTDTTEWSAKAVQAYTEVVTRFPTDTTASGKAMIMLGVLAENQGDTEKARGWYEKIVSNKQYADTPFFVQATYRLDNLAQWSTPVVFAAPMDTVPQPPDVGSKDISVKPASPGSPTIRKLPSTPPQFEGKLPTAKKTPPLVPASPDAGEKPAIDLEKQSGGSQEPSSPADTPPPQSDKSTEAESPTDAQQTDESAGIANQS